jgi:UDP-N-acetylglucosamine 2-epimerase (non-hydrolysing)
LKKLLFCFGTRPEAIKMAPLILEAKTYNFEPIVCLTGQHKEMIIPFLEFFNINSDFNLDVMSSDQNLASLTSKILERSYDIMAQVKPTCVVVQGDTTTTFACATAAFYHKIPVAHIEAGLRTHNIYSPFPEEANRKFVSAISSFHFAPTEQSAQNLYAENIQDNVYVTGNTSIDALRISKKVLSDKKMHNEFAIKYSFVDNNKKMILVTTHRRENYGAPLTEICESIKQLAVAHQELYFVLPVHLNPNVKNIVENVLGNIPNVFLLAPLNYAEFVWFMDKSYIILTDSGGVQEEGPYFKKPILILRENTERPEGIESKTAVLVGHSRNKIINEIEKLLQDNQYYASFQNAINPYGDGSASSRILKTLRSSL